MTILVTGHRGKLGGNIFNLLGDEARGYDLQDGQNILDGAALLAAMQGCTAVVHCAGIPHPNAGTFTDYMTTNVWGTMNVCQAAVAAGLKRVVYFSSTAWYGCNASGGFAPEVLPVTEEHPPNPVGAASSYGASKRMAEEVLRWYGTNHQVETVALRSAPANPKSGQFPPGFDWSMCDDYRNRSLFANCHPDYAARAAVLAVRHAGPFWYEVFNLCDRYAPNRVDLHDFLWDRHRRAMLPDHWAAEMDLEEWIDAGRSLFSTAKAERVLGWEPCDERE